MNDLTLHAEITDDLLDPSGSLFEDIFGETGASALRWSPEQPDIRTLVEGEPRALGRCGRGQHHDLRPEDRLLPRGSNLRILGRKHDVRIQDFLRHFDHLESRGRI